MVARTAAANSRPITDQAFMTDFLLTVFSVGDPNMKGTTRRVGQDPVLVEADGDLNRSSPLPPDACRACGAGCEAGHGPMRVLSFGSPSGRRDQMTALIGRREFITLLAGATAWRF